ncbi:MAG: glycosyltransferase involved in cell wall biosynthesis [Parvicella sp.]|jgi:glycosyltransferase involved in cell wall biosynthesis
MAKKILCIHQGYELYGSDRSFITSLAAFRSEYPDGEINVYIPKKGVLYDYLLKLGYSVSIQDIAKISKEDIIKLRFKKLLKPIQSIRRISREVKSYDMVYINTIVILDYIFSSFFFKPKCIIHVREIPTGILKAISKIVLSASGAHLIFNSRATRKVFDKTGNKRNYLLYNGVKPFSDVEMPRNGSFRLLIIGRLIPWKGQLFALEAIGKYRKLLPKSVSLRILGSVFEDQKEYYEMLKDRVRKYQLEGIVEFVEFVDDPSEHYEWCNILLVPSTKPEPFGRIAIEAMGVGRPVIAANHGGLPEIVIHRKTGLLFEPRNMYALVAAIKELTDGSVNMQEYGLNGKKRFNEQFNEDIYHKNFRMIVKDIMKSD